jgi:hypothetical protein
VRKTGIVAKKRRFSMEVRLVATVGQTNALILLHWMYMVDWELNTASICSIDRLEQATSVRFGKGKM